MAFLRPQVIVKLEFLLQTLARYPLPVRCPHCRSGRHRLVARKYAVVRVQRCQDCGLQFTQPIYRSWLSTNFYDDLYEGQGWTTDLPTPNVLEHLRATRFAGTDKDADRQLAAIRRIVGERRGSLLELGSSWGYFLFQA